MRNMKGFVFTIDAVFALIVAGFAISVIAYVNFTSPSYYQVPQTTDYTLLSSMVQANIASMNGISYAKLAGLAGKNTGSGRSSEAGLSSTDHPAL